MAHHSQAGFDKLNPVGRPMRYKFLVRNDVDGWVMG